MIRRDVSVIVPIERYQELIEKEKNYDESLAKKEAIERGIREGISEFNDGISRLTERLRPLLNQEGNRKCTKPD